MVVHYWDTRSLATFDWWCIFDVFESEGCSDYMFVNVPLWFILCIFFVRYYYWFICELNKIVLLIIAFVVMLFRNQIDMIATPFMMNNAVYWLGFFIIGNLIADWVVSDKIKLKITMMIISGLLSLVLYFFEPYINSEFLLNAVVHIERIAIILFTVMIFACVKLGYVSKPLKFLGENTLAILGYHVLVLIPFGRFAHKLSAGEHYPYMIGLTCSVLTAIVLYFVIKYTKKYFPALVGKGNLIK